MSTRFYATWKYDKTTIKLKKKLHKIENKNIRTFSEARKYSEYILK